MPCSTGISGSDEARHFEILLCKACKFLTVEQIKSITSKNSGICDGLDWYSYHLWLDCNHSDNITGDINDKSIALNELHRIGYYIKKHPIGTELIKINEKE